MERFYSSSGGIRTLTDQVLNLVPLPLGYAAKEETMSEEIQWFAKGGGIARCGPFQDQIRAWESMRYTDKLRKETGLDHPGDTAVWPERSSVVGMEGLEPSL